MIYVIYKSVMYNLFEKFVFTHLFESCNHQWIIKEFDIKVTEFYIIFCMMNIYDVWLQVDLRVV